MKSIYLSLVMLCTAVAGYSQFQKNDVLLNGSLNFNTNNTKPNSGNTNFSTRGTGAGISLNASRFVSDKAFNSIGVFYGYSSNKQNTPGNEAINANHNAGLSFGHTRLSTLAQRFYLTFPFTLNAGRSFGNTKNNGVKANETNSLDVSLNASIGLLYQTKKNLVFTCTLPALASVYYNNGNTKNYSAAGVLTNTAKTNGFGFGGNLGSSTLTNISVGIGYLIR